MPRFFVVFMALLSVHSASGMGMPASPPRLPDPQLLPCHWLLAVRGEFRTARRIESIRDFYDNPLDVREISVSHSHAIVRTDGQSHRGISMTLAGEFRRFIDVWEISPRHLLVATVPIDDDREQDLPASLSRDGQLLAHSGRGSMIHVERVASATVTHLVPTHTLDLVTPGSSPGSHATALMFRPGHSIVAGRRDGSLWLLNAATPAPPYPIGGKHRGPVVALAQASDSSLFAVASLSRGPSGEVHLHFGEASHRLPLRHPSPAAVALSERRREIAVISTEGWLELFSFEGEPGMEVQVDPSTLKASGMDENIFRKPGLFQFENRDDFLVLSSAHDASGLVWIRERNGTMAFVLGGLVAH